MATSKEQTADNLQDIAAGRFNTRTHVDLPIQSPTFVRMVVMDVISDPNVEIFDQERVLRWHAMQVTNMEIVSTLPRNSIVAKRVADDSNPMFVYPFFPSHLSLPCKPGEAVWVMIENPASSVVEAAFWFCRIVEPHFVDDVNHAHPGRSFEVSLNPGTLQRAKDEEAGTAATGENIFHELRNGPVIKFGDERTTDRIGHILRDEPEDIFEFLLTGSYPAKYMSYESVPRFRKRPGDVVLEGSNNSLIVLGTDRTGSISQSASTYAVNAGSVDIVAGRGQTANTSGTEAETTSFVGAKPGEKGVTLKTELNKSYDFLSPDEGDIDFLNDKSRILVSQRTAVDSGFHLSSFNNSLGITSEITGEAAIAIKSDKIRLIARSDLQLVVTNYEPSETITGISESDDLNKWASIVIKTNGDIVFRPSAEGYIKLGDDTADRALLCTDLPATKASGKVLPTTAALTNTMGGKFGGTQIPTQGTWAKKVLVTGANAPDSPESWSITREPT